MLPKLAQVQDTYQGQTVTVTKVEVDGEATLRLKDGLITDGTYIYRMIARADQAREIVVSIGNISVSYSLSAVYETFSQSYMSVVAENNPCVTIIFPTGTYYLYQVELDGNSVSSDLLEHIEDVSTKTDEAYEKAYQAMPKYTTCSSADSATAKVTASITNFDTSLPTGMRVSVLMQNANTAVNPTLSVSNTPAYPILTSSGEAITADNLDQVSWPQNALVTFVFDGAHWRIDDSVALTKIDHILTEDLWSSNRNSFINLNDGVFNYGQGAFQWDGSQLHITGDVDASGTLHGAKIEGSEMSIKATGNVTNSNLEYDDRIMTDDAVSTDNKEYKYVRIDAYTRDKTSKVISKSASIDLDPLYGTIRSRANGGYSWGTELSEEMSLHKDSNNEMSFMAANINYPTVSELANLYTLMKTTASFANSLYDVLYTLAERAASYRVTPSLADPDISVDSLQVFKTAGLCMVTLEMSGGFSDWTDVAYDLPKALQTWYTTSVSWASSYAKPMRIRVSTAGNLAVRYGSSSVSRISFCYPCDPDSVN